MAEVCAKSLYEAFAEVPDPRSALGTQHPLPALLTLATVAMLCGSLLAFIDVKVGFNPSELFLALAAFAAIVVVWLRIPAKL